MARGVKLRFPCFKNFHNVLNIPPKLDSGVLISIMIVLNFFLTSGFACCPNVYIVLNLSRFLSFIPTASF